MMSMNEKKMLFAFGCPNRDLTVERLRHAAALAVDPAAKKALFSLAVKLYEDATDEQYRNFYYNMRLYAPPHVCAGQSACSRGYVYQRLP